MFNNEILSKLLELINIVELEVSLQEYPTNEF